MRNVFLVLSFCWSFAAFAQGDPIVIMIDPGHGGSDPGHEAVEKGQLPEKELNLIIAMKFGAYLSEKLDNVKVLYTRTSDTYLTLDERVALANSKQADIFISVHCNGSDDHKVHGTETHVHSMRSGKAVALAKEIEKDLRTKAGRKSRGVKDTDDREHSLHVLKYTKMTSVLVECGFLTNTNEAAYLNTEKGQDFIASALYRGVKNYVGDQVVAAPAKPEKATAKPEAAEKKEAPSKTNSEGAWTIQLMSSKEWMDTEKGVFAAVSLPVDRKQVAQSGYKYVYFAGSFTSAEEAKKQQEQLRKKGFTDAMVIRKK